MILVDNCNGMMTESVARFAKSRVGEAEYVIMHPIQYLACLNAMPMRDILPGTLKEGELPPHTFTGLRLVEDEHFPKDIIDFRNAQHETVLRIKNLGVPEEVKL